MPASLALAAALLVSGCGGGGLDLTAPPTIASRPADKGADTTTAPEGRGKGSRPVPAGDLCQSQMGSFVGSMDSLRRRLAVGVTYEQYVDEIHAIRSTYRRIPVQRLEVDCLTAVGTQSEKAFNRYIEAANDWGECIGETGCGSATVEPALQRRWRIASHFLSEAEDGLRAVG